jgi:hypothetical protein
MSQNSRTKAEQPGALVGNDMVCGECGWRVSTDDRYCPGCGAAFAGAPPRAERARSLPGFGYHLQQGLGWGLGFALAGLIAALTFWTLVALAMHALR